jgi:hypothetical protein
MDQDKAIPRRTCCLGFSSGSPQNAARDGLSESTGMEALHHAVSQTFVCPLMAKTMHDPCVALDGYTYERVAIEAWFKRGIRISPLTGAAIVSRTLVPNKQLRHLIKEYAEAPTTVPTPAEIDVALEKAFAGLQASGVVLHADSESFGASAIRSADSVGISNPGKLGGDLLAATEGQESQGKTNVVDTTDAAAATQGAAPSGPAPGTTDTTAAPRTAGPQEVPALTSDPTVQFLAQWLQARTGLPLSDVEGYASILVKDGAVSVEEALGAGYIKDDLLLLGVKKPHVASLIKALTKEDDDAISTSSSTSSSCGRRRSPAKRIQLNLVSSPSASALLQLQSPSKVGGAEEEPAQASPLGRMWLWLSSRTTLSGSDIDRVVEVFKEDGATTMEYLMDADYTEDDLIGLGIKRGDESKAVLMAIVKYREFYTSIPTVIPTPTSEKKHHHLVVAEPCHPMPEGTKEDHDHVIGSPSVLGAAVDAAGAVSEQPNTEQQLRHYPPLQIPPTPQPTQARLAKFHAMLPKTGRASTNNKDSKESSETKAMLSQAEVADQVVKILAQIKGRQDENLKAGHALLDALGLGVDAFYAYDEDIVGKEETVDDFSKILVAVLHAFKHNAAVVKEVLKVLNHLLTPSASVENREQDTEWRRRFGEAGLCTILVRTFEVHLQNPVIVEFALDLTVILTLEREHKGMLGSKGACDIVCRVMDLYEDDSVLVVKSLVAIVELSLQVDQNNRRFYTAGACENVYHALRHFPCHRLVNLYACQAITQLSRDAENRATFGKLGACQSVYHSIAHFMDTRTVVEHGEGEACHHHQHSPSNKNGAKKGDNKVKSPSKTRQEREEDEKIVLQAMWAVIALSTASEDNKYIFNKVETRALLTKLQATSMARDNTFLGGKIRVALDRLNTGRTIVKK